MNKNSIEKIPKLDKFNQVSYNYIHNNGITRSFKQLIMI